MSHMKFIISYKIITKISKNMKVFGASTDSNRKHCAKFYDDPMSFNVITLFITL